MSSGEFVVVQVLTPYDGGEGTAWPDRWLDYTRCTAGQARGLMLDKDAAKWRCVHWIYKECELSRTDLDAMVTRPELYAEKPPAMVPMVEISESEAHMLGEVLYNRLMVTDETDWSDYAAVVATLRKVASPFILKLWDDVH